MSKHTPGPWTPYQNPWGCGGYIKSADGHEVANVMQTNAGITLDEHLANADLIAAAPDLLEACEAAALALPVLETMCRKSNLTVAAETAMAMLADIKSAIAKAKGGAA